MVNTQETNDVHAGTKGLCDGESWRRGSAPVRSSILKVDHIVTDIHETEEEQTSGRQIKLFRGAGGNIKSTESQGWAQSSVL